MSRLAQDYFQRTFSLPRRVEYLERDLSNGYLFVCALEQLGCVSPEEFEKVHDDTKPELVLENFRILARSLKTFGISLSRKNVASIVSEQAGASADLIMQIKRAREAREAGESAHAAEFRFRESIKTLRPKEFTRSDKKFDSQDADEMFHSDAKNILDSGIFAEIDMRCLLGKYETFRYRTDLKVKKLEQLEAKEKIITRTQAHDVTANKRKATQDANTKRDMNVTQNWAATVEVTRGRNIRDLKFELATEKIGTLKTEKKRSHHSKEQIDGIEVFETNLKRSGIGGGDDDGQGLTISYEDANAFVSRVEETAKKRWPTKEDASDFMTQLKLRTDDKRVARYEKARRRRRMLVEQGLSAAALGESTDDEAISASNSQNKAAALSKLELEKQEKYVKMLELGKESTACITERAEENIRLFAEQYRMMSDENDEARKEVLNQILIARDARRNEKHNRNMTLVGSFVNEFIADLFDSGSKAEQQQTTSPGVSLNVSDTAEMMNQLINYVRSRLNENDAPVVPLAEVLALDSWPAVAALAMNIGKWSFNQTSPTSNQPADIATSDDKDRLDVTPVDVAATESAYVGEFANLECEKGEPTLPAEVLPIEMLTEIRRSDSFVEVAQSVLETLLERATDGGQSQSGEPNFSLTPAERALYLERNNSSFSRVIAVLSDGTRTSPAVWTRVVSWIGADVSFLWDASAALSLATKLKPYMEGKIPSITFPALITLFFDALVDCPATLISAAIPPPALRVCTDLVEMSTRMLSIQGAVVGGGEIALSSIPFTESTVAILIGASLWLRSFTLAKLAESQVSVTSIPRLAIVSKNFNALVPAPDSIMFARIVDWFVRGGSRDNIPDTDAKLRDAVTNEVGAAGKGAAKKGAPPAKGKGAIVDSPSEQSALDAIIWIRNGRSVGSDIDLRSVVDIPLEERILAAFASACCQSSAFDLMQEEADIVEFAKSTGTGAEGGPRNALPVLCFQKSIVSAPAPADPDNFSAAAESEEATSSDVQATEEKDVKASPIDSLVEYNTEITISEAVVAMIASGGEIQKEPASSTETEAADSTSQEDAQISLNLLVREHIEKRRGSLNPGDKMWYLHLTRQHTFALEDVYSAHAMLCDAQATETELYGIILMSLEQAMLRIQQRVRGREAAMVSELKSNDSRWQQLCTNALQALNSPSVDTTRMKILTSDLLCSLGDIIDQRHMSWLTILSQYAAAGEEDLRLLNDSLMLISELVCNSSFHILEAKRKAATSIATLLSQANYVDFPWPLPTADSKGVSWLLDRRRDDVRASAMLLCEACESSGAFSNTKYARSGDGEHNNVLDNWKDFSSVELPSTSSEGIAALSAAALIEVYSESLTVSSSLLVSAFYGLQSCITCTQESSARLSDSVYRRHIYEHSMLSEWGGKLSQGAPDGGPVHVAFLGQYHFGVSDDPLQDSIEQLSGHNVCEARDMALQLSVLSMLAEEISIINAAASSAQRDEVNDNEGANGELSAQPPDVEVVTEAVDQAKDKEFLEKISAILIAAVKNVVKRDPNLARGWRNLARINFMIQNIINVHEDTHYYDFSASADLAGFFRAMVTSLTHSAIPCTPPSKTILRLAQVLSSSPENGTVSFSRESRISVPALIQKISADAKLSTPWWPHTESNTPSPSIHAIASIAYCCLDSNGLVVVEDLLLEMCKAPRRGIDSLFEKTLLLAAGGGPSAEKPDEATLKLLPSFLQDGIFKALQLASHVKMPDVPSDDEGAGNAPDAIPLQGGSPSSSALRLNSLSGALLQQSQVEWLIETCQKGASSLEIISEHWHAVTSPTLSFAIEKIETISGAAESTYEDAAPLNGDEVAHENSPEQDEKVEDVRSADLKQWRPLVLTPSGVHTHSARLVGSRIATVFTSNQLSTRKMI